MALSVIITLLALLIGFVLWLGHSAQRTHQHQLQTLSESACSACGTCYGPAAAKRARQEHIARCQESCSQRPGCKINFTRYWKIACVQCGTEAQFYYETGSLVTPEPPTMDRPLPESAFDALRKAVWSPEARITVEFLSGTPVWEDENYDEFTIACMRGRCERWQDPFHHRLFLITGQRNALVDYERCAESWALITTRCPDWPGLRTDRTTPAIRQHVEAVLADGFQVSPPATAS